MCASPLRFLTDGPPPPRVVLLPDSLFFSRAVPVASEAADAHARRTEIDGQVELAFEALAPFPLAQMYYGHFWTEGSPRALVFAAYRRRFTAEQTEAWAGAEWVIPTFAALLKAKVEPATTVVLSSPDGLTAIHWSDGAVPERVVYRPLLGEVTDEQRVQARDALLRQFESRAVIDVTDVPVAAAADDDDEFLFRAAGLASTFTAEEAAAMDVRDKDELLHLRRARRRDVFLWRTALGCVILFGLLVLGELGLVGGGVWQKTRRELLAAQAPRVEQIENAKDIANHIEDLRTKRLLTIEMLEAILAKQPADLWFVQISTSATNLYTVTAQGQTPNPGEISLLQDALQNLPQVATVSLKTTGTSNTGSTFTLSVTFKPNTLKPSA